MAKEVEAIIKLQIPAGKATPAPPIGPALGQKGINIMQFCNEFNQRTKDQEGIVLSNKLQKYSFRGYTPEQLNELTQEQVVELFRSRQRRRFARSTHSLT